MSQVMAQRITDLIFHLVDREPETDALSEEDTGSDAACVKNGDGTLAEDTDVRMCISPCLP